MKIHNFYLEKGRFKIYDISFGDCYMYVKSPSRLFELLDKADKRGRFFYIIITMYAKLRIITGIIRYGIWFTKHTNIH